MADLRYVLSCLKADALCSLTAFVAGITCIMFNAVHNSDMKTRLQGLRLAK